MLPFDCDEVRINLYLDSCLEELMNGYTLFLVRLIFIVHRALSDGAPYHTIILGQPKSFPFSVNLWHHMAKCIYTQSVADQMAPLTHRLQAVS